MAGSHEHGLMPPPQASPRTTNILTVLVGVVVMCTSFAAAALWPKDYSYQGVYADSDADSQWLTAEVTTIQSDGTYVVNVDSGEHVGDHVMLDPGNPALTITAGDKVQVFLLPTGEVAFGDFERGNAMLVLAIVYVLLVLIVARWRGLGALLGLLAAFGVVLFFTIPALFNGGNPLAVGLVTGSGALFLLLYLAHGPNARTTTAYLGTLVGLTITALISWWAVDASKMTGIWSEQNAHLEFYVRDVSLSGLVLCGIILAGLGILNDVTVAQASAVWELSTVRPDFGCWQLFRSGMRIGRDHIASTVYTIAFVYVGAALPTIMFITLFDTQLTTILTSADIAEEIVRTLVGSIGLVLAVPITTFIAALVVSGNRSPIASDTVPDVADPPPTTAPSAG